MLDERLEQCWEGEGHQSYHEGHIQRETITHNKSLTAQNGEGYKHFRTPLSNYTTSAKRCVPISKGSNQRVKRTYLQKKIWKTWKVT